jgi:hypothetical protein
MLFWRVRFRALHPPAASALRRRQGLPPIGVHRPRRHEQTATDLFAIVSFVLSELTEDGELPLGPPAMAWVRKVGSRHSERIARGHIISLYRYDIICLK